MVQGGLDARTLPMTKNDFILETSFRVPPALGVLRQVNHDLDVYEGWEVAREDAPPRCRFGGLLRRAERGVKHRQLVRDADVIHKGHEPGGRKKRPRAKHKKTTFLFSTQMSAKTSAVRRWPAKEKARAQTQHTQFSVKGLHLLGYFLRRRE